MKPPRIIFLDIDGVLSHVGSDNTLDHVCVARLDRLVTDTHAALVLTSSWRDQFGILGTQRRLDAAGLRARITDATPTMPTRTRSDEIDAYLLGLDTPARFVIVDDVPVARHLRPRLVLVDDFIGLTDADVERAKALLA